MHYAGKYRQWIIAGITSNGVQCNDGTYIGIYTRIAVYMQWINSVLGLDDVEVLGDSEPFVLAADDVGMSITDAALVHRLSNARSLAGVACLMCLRLW